MSSSKKEEHAKDPAGKEVCFALVEVLSPQRNEISALKVELRKKEEAVEAIIGLLCSEYKIPTWFSVPKTIRVDPEAVTELKRKKPHLRFFDSLVWRLVKIAIFASILIRYWFIILVVLVLLGYWVIILLAVVLLRRLWQRCMTSGIQEEHENMNEQIRIDLEALKAQLQMKDNTLKGVAKLLYSHCSVSRVQVEDVTGFDITADCVSPSKSSRIVEEQCRNSLHVHIMFSSCLKAEEYETPDS